MIKVYENFKLVDIVEIILALLGSFPDLFKTRLYYSLKIGDLTVVRKIFIPILLCLTLFSSCTSFNPANIVNESALTSPYSIQKDSVFVLVKQYNDQEAELFFDTDFGGYDFRPFYVSIYNNSSSRIMVDPSSIEYSISQQQAYKESKKLPIGYLFYWSIPWGINMAVGLPFYYGIAWPVFGLIATVQAANANRKREAYYKNVSLKPAELTKGQEVSGVVFIVKDKNLNINLLKDDSTRIEFEFQSLHK